MTIPYDDISVEVVGNGATTVFSYNFIIPTQSDAQLWLVDTSVTPNTYSLVLQSAWSMTGAGSLAGGTFTYPLVGSPIDSDHKLILERTVPYTQPFAFGNQGPYYPRNVESALDWLEMQIQQLVKGTVQISFGQGVTLVPVPNTLLWFDDTGTLTTLTIAELIQKLIDGGLIQDLIDAGLALSLIVDGDLIDLLISNNLIDALIAGGLVTALTPYFGGGGGSDAYDLNFDFGQDTIPGSTRVQFTIPNGRTVTFGADFLDSGVTVGTPPTSGTKSFTIKQGVAGSDTLMGSMSVTTSNVISWSTAGGVAIAVTGGGGKYVYADSPSSADSAMKGVTFTLKGAVS